MDFPSGFLDPEVTRRTHCLSLLPPQGATIEATLILGRDELELECEALAPTSCFVSSAASSVSSADSSHSSPFSRRHELRGLDAIRTVRQVHLGAPPRADHQVRK